jgi:hypothetical protein
MSELGVFAVDRGIFDHPLFDEGQAFTRREAWLWLVAEAAWKPRQKNIGGKVITLDRGQLAHSIRFMAKAWGWTKSTVDRFLGRLKTETMIGTESGTGFAIITICNYNDYQRVSLPDGTANGTPGGTAAGQTRRHSIHSRRKGSVRNCRFARRRIGSKAQGIFARIRGGMEGIPDRSEHVEDEGVRRLVEARRRGPGQGRKRDTGVHCVLPERPVISSGAHGTVHHRPPLRWASRRGGAGRCGLVQAPGLREINADVVDATMGP